jgi:transcriptional regulator with XRE-family HTH domain
MATEVMFSEWLNEQIQRSGLTQRALAKAAGVYPATISKLLNGKTTRPDPESCLGLARALKIAPETIYRAAGLLPGEPDFPEADDLKYIVAQLPVLERQKILAYARVSLEFVQKETPIAK